MNPLITSIGRQIAASRGGVAASALGRATGRGARRVAATRGAQAGVNIGSDISRTAAIGTGAAAVGLLGLAKGFNSASGDLNDAAYEILTGNPNIDEEVFGMEMNARNLLFPNINFPGPDFERMRRVARMAVQPQILGRTQADIIRRNRMPDVNGNIVHGMYRSRGA